MINPHKVGGLDKAIQDAMVSELDKQIASLNWPARSRYGIADKQTNLLVHSSDGERWIDAELKRMNGKGVLGRYQKVIRI